MFYLNMLEPSHPGGPNPNEEGWIYLTYDQYKLGQTKVGKTTKSLWSRIGTKTENPDYVLFAAFHVPSQHHCEIGAIEAYLRHKMWSTRIPHQRSRNDSEYVLISPDDALSIAVGKLPNVMPICTTEDGEWDFTTHLYLPDVNPYASFLYGSELDEYVELASPSMFQYELVAANKPFSFSLLNFLSEMRSIDVRGIYNVIGPELLLQRLGYDCVRRKLCS
jgi:hypothetical protein